MEKQETGQKAIIVLDFRSLPMLYCRNDSCQ